MLALALRAFLERAPLVSFCLSFILGILLQKYLTLPPLAIIGGAAVFLGAAWLAGRSRYLVPVLWVVTSLSGMLALANVQLRSDQIESVVRKLDRQSVELTGEIKAVRKVARGFKYRIESLGISTPQTSFDEPIQVHVYSKVPASVSVADHVRTTGTLRTLRGPRNPGEFDFRSFYQRRNIWADIYADEGSSIISLGKHGSLQLSYWVEELRDSIKRLYHRQIGGDAGRLMCALVIGLRDEIPGEIKQDFADTGVIHVLAVSGLHVGYVLLIIGALVKIMRIPYRWDKIVVILALIAYAVVTGGKASVWRATLMASLYIAAPLFHREGNLWNIIATAALGLLIYNPNYLFDLGFLLSFSAVISIVFFYKQFDRILPERLRVGNIQNPVLKGTMGLFIVSISAQVGTLPFTWIFFNRIPIVSLVANVIIVPVIGIIVSIGFAILFLGSWLPFVGAAFGNTAWLLSQVTFWLTHSFARLPFAYLELGTPSTIDVFCYFAGLVTVFLFLRLDLRKKAIIAGLVWANLLLWPWALRKNVLDVIFLDVGQGDAAVVQVPTSEGKATILVDAGLKSPRKDMGERVVLPVLKHLGVKEVDLAVMSHPHSDHIGGIESLLENMTVKEVWDTFTDYHSNLYEGVKHRVSRDSIAYRRVRAGQWFSKFEPAYLFIFHPDTSFTHSVYNVNNASIVMRLNYGSTSFLLVGDLEMEGDKWVVTYGDLLRSTVLKVGHHGSITSSTQPFLDAVKADYAIVSVGEWNKFGHPSELVIKRIQETGARVYRTDLEGAIWLKSNGERVWRYDWR